MQINETQNFYPFLIICPIGLEDLVQNEITQILSHLDSENINKMNKIVGAIELDTSMELGLKLNYHLKMATRVLWRIEQRKCRDLPKLFKILSKIIWKKYLFPGYEIEISSTKSRLFDSSKIEKTTREAIEKYYFGHPYKKKQLELFEQIKPTSALYLRFDNDTLTISIDTTGNRLDKRLEEKQLHSQASIRPTLAHALINTATNLLDSSISPLNFYDPFCGSGTFLIEAQNLTTAHQRKFNFEYLNLFTYSPITIGRTIFENIEGSEIDSTLVKKLKTHDLNVKKIDALEVVNLRPNTIIVTNPPYGLRIGDKLQRNSKAVVFINQFIEHILKNKNLYALSLILPSDYSLDITNKNFEYSRPLKFKNGGMSVTNHFFKLKISTPL